MRCSFGSKAEGTCLKESAASGSGSWCTRSPRKHSSSTSQASKDRCRCGSRSPHQNFTAPSASAACPCQGQGLSEMLGASDLIQFVSCANQTRPTHQNLSKMRQFTSVWRWPKTPPTATGGVRCRLFPTTSCVRPNPVISEPACALENPVLARRFLRK